MARDRLKRKGEKESYFIAPFVRTRVLREARAIREGVIAGVLRGDDNKGANNEEQSRVERAHSRKETHKR